jgi:hypothetical protein
MKIKDIFPLGRVKLYKLHEAYHKHRHVNTGIKANDGVPMYRCSCGVWSISCGSGLLRAYGYLYGEHTAPKRKLKVYKELKAVAKVVKMMGGHHNSEAIPGLFFKYIAKHQDKDIV